MPWRRVHSAGLVALVAASLAGGACSRDGDDGAAVRPTAGVDEQEAASGPGSASAPGGSVPFPCQSIGATDVTPTAAVEAQLAAFVVHPVPATVPAGVVQIVAVNQGFERHEVVILRHDGDPADLPAHPDGSLDESQLDDDAVVGEIQSFMGQQENPETVGEHAMDRLNGPTACSAAFELPAGQYVLFCNLVDRHHDGEFHSHFEERMYATLTVT